MPNTPVSHASLLGTTFGDYEVLHLIGRGAMGTVYLARDTKLHRLVALKVLLGSVAHNPSAVKSFHREAQAAAPLQHPGIVRIYAAGVQNATPYIAMEYVEGEPLDRFMRRNGPMKWQQALYIGGQVAQALACAHAAGIVHRDVKPANMLLDAQGHVRLTDFGIASVQSESGAADEFGFAGTPHYMAPEQCSREPVTPRSDLYALGVILYQMIAGTRPFEAEDPVALIKQITTEEAPRLNRMLTDVPDDVARLVAQLIEKDPAARPQSAQAVYAAIDRLQREQGGRSAIPEALSAFIREQSDIRGLRAEYQTSGRRRGTPDAPSPGNRLSTAVSSAIVASGVIAAAVVIAASFAWLGVRHRVETTPEITLAQADSLDDIPLPNDAIAVGVLTWFADSTHLIAQVSGTPGSIHDGATGTLLIRTGIPQAWSLSDLSGPGPRGDGFTQVLACRTFDGTHWQALSARYEPDRGAISEYALVSLAGNGTQYRASTLTTRPVDTLTSSVMLPGTRISPPPAAIDSSGAYLCVLQRDQATNQRYIGRWRLVDGRISGGETRLTSEHGRLAPDRIAFAPVGTSLLYLRERNRGGFDLWAIDVSTDMQDGQPLAEHVVPGGFAFSPDAVRLAVLCNAEDGSRTLRIIRSDTGEIESQIPGADVAPRSWHSSNAFVVGTRETGDATDVVLIRAMAPHTMDVVATIDGRVTGGLSVSPDGSRIAVGVTRDSGSFVRLLPYSNPASRRAGMPEAGARG